MIRGFSTGKKTQPIGSPENYSANPNHPFNQITGSLVAAGASTFVLPQAIVGKRRATTVVVGSMTLAPAIAFMEPTHTRT